MDINDLFLCPVCKNIPVNERENFIKQLEYRTRKYRKGDIIASQGDTVDMLYLLLKGSVKTEMIAESGAVIGIETMKAPNLLAAAFLFAQKNLFPVDVIALEDCEIVTITKSSVMKQLASNTAFLEGYMLFNSNKTNFLSERLKFLSIKTIKGKLAQYILQRTNNMTFMMDKNQTELAEYFGVARPSLARSLSEMIDEQVIELNKKQGKVLNLNTLKELLVQ